jgi:CheY-like chemotaxis protein
LAHARAPIPKLSALRPELARLDPIFTRALAKSEEERYPNVLAFGAALRAASVPVQPSRSEELAERAPESEPAGPMVRVLIVDDDVVSRKIAARCAQLAFYRCPIRVETAESGPMALERATARLPQLVVLDYFMPNMDGLAVLTALRDLHHGEEVRVVVMSSSLERIERWKLRALGVDDFVAKPLDFDAMTRTLMAVAATAGWAHAALTESAPTRVSA